MTPPFDKQSFLRELSAEELREIYDRAKREFSEEDLQKYLQPTEGIPLQSIIEELQAEQRQRKSKAG